MKMERRFDYRLPVETYLTAYFEERPQRGFTLDLSEHGLFVNTLVQNPQPPRTPVGLEFRLPGLPEVIWAAGETCRDHVDDYFYGLGIRFVAMADVHRRMLRAFVLHVRRQAGGLFVV